MLLIDNKNNTDPTLNLALEEYCVRNLDMNSDYILFYINDPSVIIGKHQNTIEEINSGYVSENGVHIVRRISGGGAVYHDNGNLNFSFMTKHSQKSIHNFKLFTEPVINVLKQLGVNAELNGRNDITVDNRKISGNAQFTDTKSMFSHGTLLFDSTLENVVKALNVNSEKIESKGIKSIRSRVANIKEFLPEDISIYEFREKIINSIFKEGIKESVYRLSDNQWEEVCVLAEKKYRSWEWNYGRSPEFNIQRINRFPLGQIDARIFIKDGLIETIKFYGDFLGHGEISDLENLLKGEKFQKENLNKILNDINLNQYLGEISHSDFINFLIT